MSNLKSVKISEDFQKIIAVLKNKEKVKKQQTEY